MIPAPIAVPTTAAHGRLSSSDAGTISVATRASIAPAAKANEIGNNGLIQSTNP